MSLTQITIKFIIYLKSPDLNFINLGFLINRLVITLKLYYICCPTGAMAEWLGNGLQNHVQRFESAWHLLKKPPV